MPTAYLLRTTFWLPLIRISQIAIKSLACDTLEPGKVVKKESVQASPTPRDGLFIRIAAILSTLLSIVIAGGLLYLSFVWRGNHSELTELQGSMYLTRTVFSLFVTATIISLVVYTFRRKALEEYRSKKIMFCRLGLVWLLATGEAERLDRVKAPLNWGTTSLALVALVLVWVWFVFLCLSQPIRRSN